MNAGENLTSDQGESHGVTGQVGVYSRAVHGLAVLLTLAVFPLIWVGGLVTTYDAGMAVPDWPGTYGWNMFAYPVSTWLFGPFDLMAEHSHRLLGTVAGFLSIGLVFCAFRFDQRAWFRWWSIGVLLAVIAQGALGGVRVLLDARTFAMIHGCTGPLFFAIATATAVMSSRWWLSQVGESRASEGSSISRSTISSFVVWGGSAMLLASYLQLIMGAQLRHVTGAIRPAVFTGFVHMHLTLAVAVFLLAGALAVFTLFARAAPARIMRPSQFLLLLVAVQILLGVGTWIANYAMPWQELDPRLANYIIQAKGYWEGLVVTGHVATGSLIISVSTVVALRAWRVRWSRLQSSALAS